MRGTHGDGAQRRDGDIAPYRHGTRAVRTAMGHAGYARQRDTSGSHGNGARGVRTTTGRGGASRVDRLPVGRKASDGAIAHGWRTHDMVGLKTPASRHEAWRARMGYVGFLSKRAVLGNKIEAETLFCGASYFKPKFQNAYNLL